MNTIPRSLAVAVLPLALAACGTPGPTASGSPPTNALGVPAAIAVPSGNRLAMTLKGSGIQNYECRTKSDTPGGYDWVLVAPEAALKDRNDALVGRHYGGPTWEYGDGSKVTGRILSTTPSPVAGNLPWVLLQGMADAKPGEFAGVTYIQRTNTSGGTAPSDSCVASAIGTRKAVRYTADYSFFKG